MIFITRRDETSYSRSSRYQPPTSITWSISRSASSFDGLLDEAEVVQRLAQRLGVLAHGGVERDLLELDLLDGRASSSSRSRGRRPGRRPSAGSCRGGSRR